MATVRDVAALAGVSISTVSRALSAPGMVSETTRERVEEAAKKLDYRPNPTARGLRVGRTTTLGLLVPDLENPFFASITKAVQSRARTSGYAVLIADSDEDASQELELVSMLAAQVDGLVLASPRSSDVSLLAAVDGLPTVLLNREVDGLASLAVDNVGGVRQSLGHLKALGHRTVAAVSGPAGSWSGAERRRGLEVAGSELGVEVVDVGHFRPTFAGGVAAADLVVASGATAVLTYNDLQALGLVDRLRQRGLEVPRDLSVVGFDDVSVATLVSPALTTVQIPLAALGRGAVDLLVEQLDGGDDAPAPGRRRAAAAREDRELLDLEDAAPDGGGDRDDGLSDLAEDHLPQRSRLSVELVVRGTTSVPAPVS